jgi:hypothetical protein
MLRMAHGTRMGVQWRRSSSGKNVRYVLISMCSALEKGTPNKEALHGSSVVLLE